MDRFVKRRIMFNKTFYPTPKNLIRKMLDKIKGHPQDILEPSAGKADIIEGMRDAGHSRCGNHYPLENFSAIEIDPDLRHILRGKEIKVIDTDFLEYSGQDQFDLIIANPPFDNGDEHLMKAINIMFRGQIIFQLNAETIRNPYSNQRKALVKRLDELNAEIEFIEGAYKDAERPTGVEIVLINIIIEKTIEDDLFEGCDDEANKTIEIDIEEKHEVSTGKTIEELVAEYNEVIRISTETVMQFYRNFPKLNGYVGIRTGNREQKERGVSGDITARVSTHLNNILSEARNDFWRKTLNIEEVRKRMTDKKRKEFEVMLKERCHLDFTEKNIRQFVLNLIGGFEKTMAEAVADIFDMFTIRYCYEDDYHHGNVHLFDGWKTNKAFQVNKKVIIPINGSYGNPFMDWGKWRLDYTAKDKLNDIDIVMNYFDGMPQYESISDAIKKAFEGDISRNIESTYFTVTCYKKGTIHLIFNDEDILRRFNVVACKEKGWLPGDYGTKSYKEMSHEEKEVVNSFEGEKSYIKNLNQPLFAVKNTLQIAV